MPYVKKARWYCWKCPLADECSDNSWKNSANYCSSFEGIDDCKAKVLRHLTVSTKHQETTKSMPADDVAVLLGCSFVQSLAVPRMLVWCVCVCVRFPARLTPCGLCVPVWSCF